MKKRINFYGRLDFIQSLHSRQLILQTYFIATGTKHDQMIYFYNVENLITVYFTPINDNTKDLNHNRHSMLDKITQVKVIPTIQNNSIFHISYVLQKYERTLSGHEETLTTPSSSHCMFWFIPRLNYVLRHRSPSTTDICQ